MSELITNHHRACERFSAVADAFDAGQWSVPTPCTAWDARALVEHVIGFHEFLVLRPLGVRANRPREDPAARWRATAGALFDCLETDGVLDRPTELPGGGHSSTRQMLGALTTDVLVHTWDLARAGGVEPRLDPRLCAAAFAAATATGLRRDDGMIGPAVVVAPGADVETRLVALYGRDPDWRPRGS
jgi:uncharacterized protein (TIGR03086 family)